MEALGALGTLHRACSVLFITAKRTSKRPFQKAERLGANRPLRPFTAILSAGGEDPSLVRRSMPEHLVHT